MILRTTLLLSSFLGFFVAAGVAGPAQNQYDFAEALFIQLDYQSAAEEYRNYLTTFPAGERASDARYRLAECHFRTEEFRKAAEAYRTALDTHPDADQAPLAHYNSARAFERLGQPQQAAASFAAAAASDNENIRREAILGAAEAEVELHNYDGAAKRYEQLLNEFPESSHAADARFSLGWVQARLGRHETADRTFRTLLAKHPDYADLTRVRLALSDSLTALEDFAESAEVLEQIPSEDDPAGEVLLRQAWNQFRSGDKAAAAQTFENYARRFPDTERATAALFNAGVARLENEQYDQAASTFQQVLRRSPEEQRAAETRYWLAVCRFNAGKHRKTVEILKRVADARAALSAQKRETLDSVHAQSLQHLGRHAEAATHLERFLETYPESEQTPAVLYALAAAREGAGRLEDALAPLRRLIEQHPKSAWTEDALFAAAEYLYRLNRPADALPYLQQLARLRTLTASALYRRAWCQYDLEQFENARRSFADLADKPSDLRGEAVYMAARAAEKLGETETARDWYRRAAEARADSEHTEKAFLRLAFLLTGAEAEKNLARYLDRFPDGRHAAAIRLRVAESAFESGAVDRAERHYARLLKEAATDAHAAYGLAWCRLKQDRIEEADALFKKALEHAEDDDAFRDDAILQRAEIAYRHEDFKRARALFSSVANHETVGERATYMLGWCARHQREHEQSRIWFRRVIDRHPGGEFRLDAAIRLAEAARQLNDPAEARQGLESTLKALPAKRIGEEFLHLYCATLVDLHDWKRTLEVCERLQAEFAESDRLYLASFRRGLALQALGVDEKALEAFRETIRSTDTVEAARAQFNIGSVLFGQQRFAEAAKHFLRVEMLYDYPELSPKALFHAVLSFRKAGDAKRAQLYAEKLGETYPETEWNTKLKTDTPGTSRNERR